MVEFILKRFKEPSTWAGLMLVATSFGMDITDQQQYAITMFGMALMGVPDKQHNDLN